ncbi:ATP-binding protein [Streptomyces sp. NPDC088124]|uniref:ATP-binding protein n=1 Tax=Streptomyces sp. NPDC088124 TaxID=3154654 RepID=UPI0034248F15
MQEALTNTLKHAAADTTVTVRITAAADSLHITVEDTGPPRLTPRGPSAGGRGLVGMRERAALYQGDVTSGPNDRGGWTVHATLAPTHHAEKHPA